MSRLSQKKSILRALEEGLAAENRRVLSGWRAVLILRKATRDTPPGLRRWSNMPTSVQDVWPILHRLVVTGDLIHLGKLPGLYETTSPFARKGPLDEEEILMEGYPFSSLAYLSALVFHNLTVEFPKEIHAASSESETIFPPGTRREDWEGEGWEGIAIVTGRPPSSIGGRPVIWHSLSKNSPSMGLAEYSPRGYPVRVTTPERTLIDGLLHPEWSGGIENVLRAWFMARDTISVNAIVDIVQAFDVTVLRQRVGFILEELGLTHPSLEQWPAQAKRGGSSKLSGATPFAPTFSERWKLSINVSIDALRGDES